MSAPTVEIPGYVAGTWEIDPVHSEVSFVVRHLGVTKVRGRFGEVSGQIVTGPTLPDSSLSVEIPAASIDTSNSQRDEHARSADLLDADNHEKLSFTSTGVRTNRDTLIVDGVLTAHGVSKTLGLNAEVGGIGPGMHEGQTVLGASATTEISRSEFGIGPNVPSAVVSDMVKVELDIEAILAE
jgi:polyisoprenoid-binding protein YceI